MKRSLRTILPACIACALLLLTLSPALRAANQSTAAAAAPSHDDQVISFLQAIVADMLPYAKKDKDIKQLLETQKLDKSVDWDALKDTKKAEPTLVAIMQELVRLAPTNAHAKTLVAKYNIKVEAPKQ